MGTDPLIRRMDDAEAPRVLDLLAAGASTRRSVESWRHDAMTALLLGPADAPVAAMPLARRNVPVAPGRVLKAGWLSANQFAGRMGLRRQSRATAARWPELLPDVDALLVLRREESSLVSPAARWYARVGFHDVLAVRCLYLDMHEAPAAGAARFSMKVVDPADVGPWAGQMAQVYREVFGNYGGAVMRGAGFWAPALANHFYKAHYQFQIIGLWAGGGGENLVGYAVVGWSGWHSKRPRMDILELATRQWDTTVAQELIRTTCQLAWGKNVSQVRAVVSVHDPYRPHLTRVGFADRWGYTMLAKWLHPQKYLDQTVSPGLDAGAGAVELSVTGDVPLTVRPPGATGPTLRVRGDARAMTRLLLQRLDAAAALQDGSLIVTENVPNASTRLAMAFPWTPWIFHMLDYI